MFKQLLRNEDTKIRLLKMKRNTHLRTRNEHFPI